MITVELNDTKFDVTADGTVRQERSVSPTELDNVRLKAAAHYTSRDVHKTLTREQYRYWQAVERVSPPADRPSTDRTTRGKRAA